MITLAVRVVHGGYVTSGVGIAFAWGEGEAIKVRDGPATSHHTLEGVPLPIISSPSE